MTRTFIRLSSFIKAWDAIGLSEDDYQELETMLLKNPQLGPVIEGSGGVRKVRFAVPGKGKRGGARVIYIDVVVEEAIYFLYAYPKSVKDDLTKDEVKALRKIAEKLKHGKQGEMNG